MKIEIEVNIPAGYEATGEYRDPKIGENFFSPITLEVMERTSSMADGYRIILRKIAPKMRPMTMGERHYILSTPHCVVREVGFSTWNCNSNLTSPDISHWEYGFVREDGSIDGPYKFEKEA